MQKRLERQCEQMICKLSASAPPLSPSPTRTSVKHGQHVVYHCAPLAVWNWTECSEMKRSLPADQVGIGWSS